MQVGDRVTIQAIAMVGSQLSGPRDGYQYVSSDPSVVTATDLGEGQCAVEAIAAGSATVTITGGGLTARESFTVIPQDTVVTLAALPPQVTVRVGDEEPIDAMAQVGRYQRVPAGGFTFANSDPSVVEMRQVDVNRVIVRGAAEGSCVVTITGGNQTATSRVTVIGAAALTSLRSTVVPG
jgi:hypothetical protein